MTYKNRDEKEILGYRNASNMVSDKTEYDKSIVRHPAVVECLCSLYQLWVSIPH